jgi:23S rRNA pseudouridine1911/1915/1917 synthase
VTDPPEPLVVPATLAGERVDRALSLLTGWSRNQVQELVRRGEVLLEGHAASGSKRLVGGEVLELLGEPPPAGAPEPEDLPLRIRHEDDDVIVVAKPAGLVVHPGAAHHSGTLVNALLHRYPEIAGVGDPTRPGIVHRLDRDTSGLLVVARSVRAYDALVRALGSREVTRRYLALVWGVPDSPRGVIDAPIGRSTRRRTRMAVRSSGRDARTRYEVRERLRDDRLSLLSCELETGRTHQIRVHLAAIGHPVAGDAPYGGLRPGLELTRPFLHATVLGFLHPVSGVRVELEEPLPEDLTGALEAARRPPPGSVGEAGRGSDTTGGGPSGPERPSRS